MTNIQSHMVLMTDKEVTEAGIVMQVGDKYYRNTAHNEMTGILSGTRVMYVNEDVDLTFYVIYANGDWSRSMSQEHLNKGFKIDNVVRTKVY